MEIENRGFVQRAGMGDKVMTWVEMWAQKSLLFFS